LLRPCRALLIAALSLGLSAHFPGAGCARKPSPAAGSAAPGTATTRAAAPQPGGVEKPVPPEPVPTAPLSPLPTSPLSEADSAEISKTIEKTKELRKALKYEEALQLLEGLLARNPPPGQAAEILFSMGECSFRQGQDAQKEKLPGVDFAAAFRQGAKHLERVLKLYPQDAKASSASYLLGSTFLMLEELEKALTVYQQTFDNYPSFENRAQALLRVGVCQAGLGQAESARSTFQKVVREFPGAKKQVADAEKYSSQLGIVGRAATPIATREWLAGQVGPDGLKAFDGEVVFVIFFATWCENCEEEAPHLRRLLESWSAKGVVFLGVANPDDPKSTMPVEVYLQKYNIRYFDVALDRTFASWTPYRVTGLPAGVLIDRKGIVRWRGHPAFFPGPLVEKALSAP
jgi:tetratricopeptide (TPR) repeat protein